MKLLRAYLPRNVTTSECFQQPSCRRMTDDWDALEPTVARGFEEILTSLTLSVLEISFLMCDSIEKRKSNQNRHKYCHSSLLFPFSTARIKRENEPMHFAVAKTILMGIYFCLSVSLEHLSRSAVVSRRRTK